MLYGLHFSGIEGTALRLFSVARLMKAKGVNLSCAEHDDVSEWRYSST